MKRIILLAIVMLTGYGVYSQDLSYKLDTTIQNQIDPDGPGVTVLIRHNGDIIYKKAFGMANIEQGIKMEPGHVFRIGSITKQFTACAILRLVEEGKISLEDDITKYLPGYPTEGRKINIEHLLTHTSGIKSYTGMEKWTDELRRKDFKPLELIEYFKVDTLEFEPGEKFAYNNSAYFILGYIIEKVSGMSYEDYIEHNFFMALGMDNSYYDHPEEIIPMRVSGYEMKGDTLINAPYLSMTQPYAAG
jgi:CubicO group peptidase (beta-lactamase class C family)